MEMDKLQALFAPLRGFRLFAGFSGGADSTAALLMAHQAAAVLDLQITAVHFNHHLRGAESDAEALAAEKFAAALGVEFRKYDIYPAPGDGVEARAREMRMEVWRHLAGGKAAHAVVLGHHLDDRIENLFLRLGRGSNASGAAGLHRDTVVSGVRIFRPLANMHRSEVEAFLRENQVTAWAQDSSNQVSDTLRNRLRNDILPQLFAAFPDGGAGFAAAVENLALDAEYLDREAQRLYHTGTPEKVEFWQNLPDALFSRAARLFLDETCGENMPLNRSSLQRLHEAVNAGSNGVIPLSGKRFLRLAGGTLSVDGEAPETVSWHWRDEPETVWGNWRFSAAEVAAAPERAALSEAFFDGGTLPEILTIGAVVPGESMVPFGGGAEVRIKKLRIDRKIPAFPAVPAVRDMSQRVLWVPGVRHSDHCKVGKNGQCIRIFAEKVK